MFTRWATEDPNPVAIKHEKRRIETLGKDGIARQIDSNLVEAVQSIRTLEDGETENFYPIEASGGNDDDGDDDQRQSKRARVDDSISGGAGGGIFGKDAMENIKYFADMARKQAEEARASIGGPGTGMGTTSKPAGGASAAKAKAGGLGALGGYGSDSD